MSKGEKYDIQKLFPLVGWICNKNAFFSAFYILVQLVIFISVMSLKIFVSKFVIIKKGEIVSLMASIQLYCKYFDDNKLYLVALMYLLQV
jgi:hypothetical protein